MGPNVRIFESKRSGMGAKNRTICPGSGAGVSYNFSRVLPHRSQGSIPTCCYSCPLNHHAGTYTTSRPQYHFIYARTDLSQGDVSTQSWGCLVVRRSVLPSVSDLNLRPLGSLPHSLTSNVFSQEMWAMSSEAVSICCSPLVARWTGDS